MTEFKSLAVTAATMTKLSRHEMLQWVNFTLSAKYNKIEELCSGVAYCQLMEMLFPNCIGLKKVRTGAKLEHEFAFNLKLFQGAFMKLNFDKSVPIDRLVKGRFQDNFEFLQWFKKFYDIHSRDNRGGEEDNSKSIAVVKPIRKAISATNLKAACSAGAVKKTTPTSASSSKAMRAKSSSTSHLTPRTSQPSRPISPSSMEVLTETATKLKKDIGTAEEERNYYFNKLRQIETLCTENEKKSEDVELTKKVLTILYGDYGGEAVAV